MIWIDLLATLFEDIVLCYTCFHIYKVKSIKLLLLTSIICTLETLFFNYIYAYNNLLLGILVITIGLNLSLYKKKFDLSYFIFPIIIMGILTMANTFSLIIGSFVSGVSILEVTAYPSIFILTLMLSRIIFLIASLAILKIGKFSENDLPNTSILFICIFLYTSILMFGTLVSAVVYNILSMVTVYKLIIYFFILVISSLCVYHIILKQNKENLKISQKLVNEKHQEKLYSVIQQTDATISKDIHMMKYTLMKIINYLSAKDNVNALNFAKEELNRYSQYKRIHTSNNPLFDFEFTNLINRLRQNKIDIKTVLEIQENTILFSDSSMIGYIINLIDYICNMEDTINSVQLFLEEFETHYKMRIIVDFPITKELIIEHHPKLTKHVIHNGVDYTEFSFLFMKSEYEEGH